MGSFPSKRYYSKITLPDIESIKKKKVRFVFTPTMSIRRIFSYEGAAWFGDNSESKLYEYTPSFNILYLKDENDLNRGWHYSLSGRSTYTYPGTLLKNGKEVKEKIDMTGILTHFEIENRIMSPAGLIYNETRRHTSIFIIDDDIYNFISDEPPFRLADENYDCDVRYVRITNC